ncbi:hypothetical protein DLM77_21285, partial [Leptospira yasudae]
LRTLKALLMATTPGRNLKEDFNLDKRLHFSHRSLYFVKEYNQSGEPGSQKSQAINVWLFYLELGDGRQDRRSYSQGKKYSQKTNLIFLKIGTEGIYF